MNQSPPAATDGPSLGVEFCAVRMAKGMLALLWSLDVLTRVLRFLVPDEARYEEMQQIFEVLWHGQRKEKLELIHWHRGPPSVVMTPNYLVSCYLDNRVYHRLPLFHKGLVRFVLELRNMQKQMCRELTKWRLAAGLLDDDLVDLYRQIRLFSRAITGELMNLQCLLPEEPDVYEPLHPDWLPPVQQWPVFPAGLDYVQYLDELDWYKHEYGDVVGFRKWLKWSTVATRSAQVQ